MTITVKMLKELRACNEGIERFKSLFPGGTAEVTPENCWRALRGCRGYFRWVAGTAIGCYRYSEETDAAFIERVCVNAARRVTPHPYESDYAEPSLVPRRATPSEIAAGRTCHECLRASERHENGKPTIGLRRMLHCQNVKDDRTCAQFAAPIVMTYEHQTQTA